MGRSVLFLMLMGALIRLLAARIRASCSLLVKSGGESLLHGKTGYIDRGILDLLSSFWLWRGHSTKCV